MSLITPPRPSPAVAQPVAPAAGVIDDAKRRRNRRRGRIALLATVALLAGVAVLLGGGSGGGATGRPGITGGLGPRASTGNGITVRYPTGWRLLAPPITALSYPRDRLLLTSYPAATGGSCSPTRAENALPPTGALIYLLEYAGLPASSVAPGLAASPPKPGAFTLNSRELANYECWSVPTYLIRFHAAGRLFQLHVALGAHATPTRRAQVLRILDSLRFQPPAQPPHK
jgi:hypothetical protein